MYINSYPFAILILHSNSHRISAVACGPCSPQSHDYLTWSPWPSSCPRATEICVFDHLFIPLLLGLTVVMKLVGLKHVIRRKIHLYLNKANLALLFQGWFCVPVYVGCMGGNGVCEKNKSSVLLYYSTGVWKDDKGIPVLGFLLPSCFVWVFHSSVQSLSHVRLFVTSWTII